MIKPEIEYWTTKMDEAFNFMKAIQSYPVKDQLERMCSISDAALDSNQLILFSDSSFPNGHDRIFMLRESLISPLLGVARDLYDQGWILKIEDAYRSSEMQKSLCHNPAFFDLILDMTCKEIDGIPSVALVFKRVSALIATSAKVGTHISGSAIDISVIEESSGDEVCRGAPYLTMNELTPMDSPFVDPIASLTRDKISQIFRKHNFVEYPFEFWHYSSGDAYDNFLNSTGMPARFGPVYLDTYTGEVNAVENSQEVFLEDQQILKYIDESFQRQKLV